MRNRYARFSNSFLQLGFLIWLIETVVFLMIDGWHTKPIRTSEMFFDFVALVFIGLGLVFFIMNKNNKVLHGNTVTVLIESEKLIDFYGSNRIYYKFPESAVPSEHNVIEIASVNHPDTNITLRVIKRRYIMVDGQIGVIKLDCLV